MKINGYSLIHVDVSGSATNNQNKHWRRGGNTMLYCSDVRITD